jgi:hypothetical protein
LGSVEFFNLDVPVRFLIGFFFVAVGLCMQIEFEPEYHVNFGNPDIDEKPPNVIGGDASECEALHSCFQNQEVWEIIS